MTLKIIPTDIMSVELVFKDYVTFKENVVYLTEFVLEHVAKFFKGIMPDYVLVIYEMFDPVCPYCGAKLHKHEIKEWKMNKDTTLHKQRYKCTNPKCSKTITTPLPDIIDKNCCYTKEIRKIGNEIEDLEHISYGKKAELIEKRHDGSRIKQGDYSPCFIRLPYPFRKLKELYQIFCGIIISHKTVRKAQIITNDLYYLNQEIKPSGFYSYDVRWEPLDDGYHYRHLLFDLVNNAPVAELLAPDEDLKTTYDFINKSVKSIDRKAIVTDLKPGYDNIMKKLGFKHQHCIYHLRLAINERIKKFLQQKDIELRIQFKKRKRKNLRIQIKQENQKRNKKVK